MEQASDSALFYLKLDTIVFCHYEDIKKQPYMLKLLENEQNIFGTPSNDLILKKTQFIPITVELNFTFSWGHFVISDAMGTYDLEQYSFPRLSLIDIDCVPCIPLFFKPVFTRMQSLINPDLAFMKQKEVVFVNENGEKQIPQYILDEFLFRVRENSDSNSKMFSV